jgi:hypothetical protein
MKIHAHWRRHVEAWRESGLSQAAYCQQQRLNRKTFSEWTHGVFRLIYPWVRTLLLNYSLSTWNHRHRSLAPRQA